jgi:DNA-binding GntR family transcriptional regulator
MWPTRKSAPLDDPRSTGTRPVSPGATFERVYLALKEQLGSGRYPPGEHLEPGALSYELNSSITPVRDALHRLVGERLVDAPRGDGFRMPLVTEMGLRHLYGWAAKLTILAAAKPSRLKAALGPVPSAPDDLLASTERLLVRIAGRSGNPEHVDAVARLNDRLRPVRRIEVELVEDAEAELEAMAEADRVNDAPALRRLLSAYFRRRERMAAEIVAALQRQG